MNEQPPHIVDTLIEERAPGLMQHPRLWRFIQRYGFKAFGYHEAKALIDFVASMSGKQIFDHMSDQLDMRVSIEGLPNIPASGRAVVVPNHPAGIADGIAVYDALRSVRDDISFFANRDAVRCAPQLSEMIIPVEWMAERKDHTKSKETVRNMVRAFRDERLIVIFPSGRLAQPTLLGLKERPWIASGVNLAQKYECPIIPMHLRGYNSLLYYLLWYVNDELKDMTLFRELLNKRHQRYRVRIGEAIRTDMPAETLTPLLRSFVTEQLARGETTRFPQPDSAHLDSVSSA